MASPIGEGENRHEEALCYFYGFVRCVHWPGLGGGNGANGSGYGGSGHQSCAEGKDSRASGSLWFGAGGSSVRSSQEVFG